MTAYQFASRDGLALTCHESGAGRPLILLHGYMGTGPGWLEVGHAGSIAEQGYRLILPTFRGHGQSARPQDPAAYPPDVLADDGLALIDHLGLGDGDYDLGGYSLGGRIVVRMLARGARPGRAIVAGQGLAKVSGVQGGGVNGRVLTALIDGLELEPGSPEARMAAWISQLGADPRALLGVLSSLVPTPEADLRRITVPTLVAIGDQDERSDADELAALLPNGQYLRIRGGHGDVFTTPDLVAAITAFLTNGAAAI